MYKKHKFWKQTKSKIIIETWRTLSLKNLLFKTYWINAINKVYYIKYPKTVWIIAATFVVAKLFQVWPACSEVKKKIICIFESLSHGSINKYRMLVISEANLLLVCFTNTFYINLIKVYIFIILVWIFICFDSC